MDSVILANEALKLPPSERAQIIDTLWRSLDPTEQDAVDQAWLLESKDRLAAFRAGQLTAIDGEEALRAIEDELEAMKFRLLRPAARELREAAKYYEDRVPGLGFDFLQEVRASIRHILIHPQAWFALDAEIRRCRTHRFPYGIIYAIERDEVLIISVMHLHRHPESWRRNLP